MWAGVHDLPLFELLMRRYNQRLYRVARAIVKSDAEAEDVTQQAYVNAYAHLGDFEGRAKLATWLGLATFIERRWHADHNRVDVLQLGKVRARIEVATVHKLLNLVLANVLYVGFARIEQGDFGRIGVKAGHLVACFGKPQSQRKSYVPAANNPHFDLRAFGKLRAPFGRHVPSGSELLRLTCPVSLPDACLGQG